MAVMVFCSYFQDLSDEWITRVQPEIHRSSRFLLAWWCFMYHFIYLIDLIGFRNDSNRNLPYFIIYHAKILMFPTSFMIFMGKSWKIPWFPDSIFPTWPQVSPFGSNRTAGGGRALGADGSPDHGDLLRAPRRISVGFHGDFFMVVVMVGLW